ncbi:class D sortase [Bacillus sp. S/N-304-OC-R1]|uniref:class D sortase n=1 Tax=Bacillus sp. S/N-304-OC-R1 TaxID=2758034 RepID=UPI001C8D2BB5|nr:class D sortase [Bacillus sp. S/N-304-OC-R1]MBY0122949.1 class D sortase [Bacillus sp. S/N-304-OC-R1]
MKHEKKLLITIASLLILIGCFLVLFSLNDIYTLKNNNKHALKIAKERFIVENTTRQADMNTSVLQKEQTIDYIFRKGDVIGILEIPKLNSELPIVEGTSEDELEKGVGHYSSTALPGQPDQILLSGHRETVFRKLGELQNGDIFQVKMPYGTFSYEIIHSQVVDADDPTVIKSTAPTETLTVSTCYPFSYIGDAPYRYVLTAHRVENPVTK